MNNLLYNNMPHWCAATKISNARGPDVGTYDIQKILETVRQRGYSYSAVCVSSNRNETALNKWLRENGFKKGPIIKNYQNHNGRNTYMWFRQTTEKEFKKLRGY